LPNLRVATIVPGAGHVMVVEQGSALDVRIRQFLTPP
jgi:hypothetical protein